MAAIIRWTRAIATCGLCAWWALACGEAAMAVSPVSDSVPGYDGPRPAVPCPAPAIPGPGMVPCKDQCPCISRARTFGVTPTQWREWPGELRPDKTFPASINKEVLRTPPGQEPIPVPRGTLVPPGTTPDGAPGAKDILPGTGGFKMDSRLPGGGLGGLEEPSEQPKTPSGAGGILPGLPGFPLTPSNGAEKPKPGAKDTPSFEPPTTPKTNEDGYYRRPRGIRPADPTLDGLPLRQEDGNIRADWSRVLEPGARGQADLPRFTQTVVQPTRPQPDLRPIRQAAHQAADVPGRSAVQRPVFEQAVGQPGNVAQASWQPENRPAMLDGYCPVDLGKNERWSKGDPALAHTYQGMTFHFANAMQRECFLVDPERYVPAYSGSDAVLLIDGNRTVPGKVDFCVTYDGRLYTFSSAESLAKFRQQPKRYTLTGR